MKVVSIVGLAGAGKSEVARIFEGAGFRRIRFGDLTDAEVRRRGLEVNESNERLVRELLRKEHGMAAYAKLNLPVIDSALEHGDVVVDGLYSWEEYLLMKSHYGDSFRVVAVFASPATRYGRLAVRGERGLKPEDAASRDVAEIEHLNKGGPIAIADFTIINECSFSILQRNVRKVMAALK